MLRVGCGERSSSDDHDPRSGALDVVGELAVDSGVGDDRVDVGERGDLGEVLAAELRVVGEDDRAPGGGEEGALDPRLGEIGRAEPSRRRRRSS